MAALWWVLTGGRIEAWPEGSVAVAAAVLASFALPGPIGWRFRPAGVLRFLPFFLSTSLRAGIDVARRVYTPALPLAPGLVDYDWRLEPGPARVFLANTVSLLPGTLTIGFDDRKLTIHALDRTSPIHEEVARLEVLVAGIFHQQQVD
jgi:multicomponent Na+:H+ antiporter subunit E